MKLKKLKAILLTALKSILSNKARNFLTMFGIIIGIAAVITIMSVGNGLKQKANSFSSLGNADGQISIQSKDLNSDQQLSFSKADIQLVETVPGIKRVKMLNKAFPTPVKVQVGDKSSEQNAIIQNSNHKFTVVSGHPISSDAFELGLNQVLISEQLNQKLKKYNHGRKVVFINQKGFEVDGIFEDGQDSEVLIPQRAYVRDFGSNPNQDLINLYVDKGFNKKATLKAAAKTLQTKSDSKSQVKFAVVDNKASMKFMNKIIDYIAYFIIFVASISLLIAGIGVMNTMYMTISERTQEIGIRRAFGATKNDIRLQFLFESAMLTLLGGFGGILLGEGICYVIGAFAPFKPVTSLQAIGVSVGVSVSIGIVFGIIPANQAARKNLIEIL